ncbi:MAG: GTP cyclohydrolase I [Nanoarchaeota archaeon]
MDEEKVKDAIRVILKEIGEDLEKEGIKFTPDRIARLYKNLFYGYTKKLKVVNEEERNGNLNENDIPITVFKNNSQEMLIRKVSCISHCMHHLSPFPLTVWVGIIPDKLLLGMNKIDRIVKYFSAKLQIQENLTNEIADWINNNIKPKGVITVMKGVHFCAELQGDSGDFTTSAVRGIFLKPEEGKTPKEEFLKLIDLNKE